MRGEYMKRFVILKKLTQSFIFLALGFLSLFLKAKNDHLMLGKE